MIKLNYNLSQKKLECNYMRALFSKKFGKGKNTKSVKKKFDELKLKYPFDMIFFDISFVDIIFVKPENIRCLINKIKLRIIEQSKIKYKEIKKKKTFIYDVNNELEKIFKYENKFQSPISKFFEKNLETRTCYFCNIHFVNEYKVSKTEYKNEFTLDHYYDKGTYPYLALSLYNLIPSCYTCNSKLKKTIELNVFAPNSGKFDFHQKVKFKLLLDDSCKNLHIKSKDDIDINLKENYSDIYDKYIEIFKLNERYKAHKDIVFDMIQKAELYPESRLKELQDLTGIPFQQIKKDIFNLINENEDLSKQPFSKLIVDMSKELGIL
ncbi:MAG: hypothetical protein AB7S49_07340 [Arcobacter sp.]|uniref:hypothetical protein n=1 Tax=Arcobacter sp. TaxID=1872629 RepID=UPI003CFDF8C3